MLFCFCDAAAIKTFTDGGGAARHHLFLLGRELYAYLGGENNYYVQTVCHNKSK